MKGCFSRGLKEGGRELCGYLGIEYVVCVKVLRGVCSVCLGLFRRLR